MTGSAESVLITDYAWPDLEIERGILEAAGLRVLSLQDAPAGTDGRDLIADCAAVMTCWAPVPETLLAAGPALRCVARFGVGTDNIDLAYARSRGMVVTYVPDYCMEEVSDHALALSLGWARGVVWLDAAIRSGVWNPAGVRLRRFRTLTTGVWGYGRIGRRTAEKFAGMGSEVLAWDPVAPDGGPAERVSLEELLARCDIVSLHMPASADGSPQVSDEQLRQMKPGALLVNTARGTLVDTDALLRALDSGTLGAAALDVVAGEPDLPAALVAHPRVILTPHVAFSSVESVRELRTRAAQDVVRVLRGEQPQNPVPG
jgi:D-3-phosphoglycerate dehydrogenase